MKNFDSWTRELSKNIKIEENYTQDVSRGVGENFIADLNQAKETLDHESVVSLELLLEKHLILGDKSELNRFSDDEGKKIKKARRVRDVLCRRVSLVLSGFFNHETPVDQLRDISEKIVDICLSEFVK